MNICTLAVIATALLAVTSISHSQVTSSAAAPEIWKDANRSAEERATDLVRRMTLEERATQIQANPPAIERLGIPAYSHRNECLHGVANGTATVFPQAIGMAATWDVSLIREEADVIATEGRAKHNDHVQKNNGNTGEHFGVNFYSPNINIFRDPRWGRGQETYGEDPFLTAEIGVAFVRGLQGDDLDHPKALGCAKHYAVHSGPEKERHHFNAQPSERDLYDTYLPAFEALVKDAKVGSVMGAYSALNGVPCCADPFLLTEVLRKRWGFDGVVFSDGGAIGDIWAEHKFVAGPVEAAAVAVKAGCDVSSGGMKTGAGDQNVPGHLNDGLKGGCGFVVLPDSVKRGLISEKEVNHAVERELAMRFRLGMLDPLEKTKFGKIGIDQNDTPEHRALALKVANASMVLLKNNGVLPLDKSKIKRIAVVGPNADSARMQNGNYAGKPSDSATIVEGIKALAGGGVQVTYDQGCLLALKRDGSDRPNPDMVTSAVASAKVADVVVFVGGLSYELEKEEGSAKSDVFKGFSRGDRTRIELPEQQEELIKALHATGKPVVLVNCSGSAIAMPWEKENLPAILQAWYPGEEGGNAVAQTLFGENNPAGRLPVTFYAATQDLPEFTDYSMKNRTYKYFGGKPLWAFGHGLSYTKFEYSDAKLANGTVGTSDTVHLTFTVKNTGGRDGDEVSQVYFRESNGGADRPKLALCGFARTSIVKGELKQVTIEIPTKRFRHWDPAQKDYVVELGKYELMIGSASDDVRLKASVSVDRKGS
jgi:beta-glucosidase